MKHLVFTAIISVMLVMTACTTSNSYTRNVQQETKTVDSSNKENIVYQPLLVSDKLPSNVDEQSGMVRYKNLFWVNNDSDCMPSLFAYNKKGEQKYEVKVKNAKNLDWEDLAEDDKYIYIGDFGNNFGVRKNLRVLRVKKEDLGDEEISEVEADKITFEWADQQEFNARKQSHDYDCEAFFAYGDSLYFFTKNWANLKTRMYAMPKTLAHHKLQPKAELDVDFLVTGADISSDGKTIALIGYKNFLTYLMLISNFKNNQFFNGKHLRIDMSPLGGAQTEGVVFGENDALYISTEATLLPQALYRVEWEQWKDLLK